MLASGSDQVAEAMLEFLRFRFFSIAINDSSVVLPPLACRPRRVHIHLMTSL